MKNGIFAEKILRKIKKKILKVRIEIKDG